jgi:hypothetical protein
LLAAQSEYLLALQTKDALAKGGALEGKRRELWCEAARRRLELWDVPTAEIDRLDAHPASRARR